MEPAAFNKARQSRILELETSFVNAMKTNKYADALRFAKIVMELEPGNARFKEFIPLLEEKVANDASDDEGSSGDEAAGEGEAAPDESEGDSDDSDEESEDESEDEEEEGKDEAPGLGPNSTTVGDADVFSPENITLNPRSLNLSKQERNNLRNSLKQSIQNLKEKEIIEKLKSSDPLLG